MAGRCDLLLAMCLNAAEYLCDRFDLAGDVPDEGRELTRDRHTDLVERKLAREQMTVASGETQLRAPGDIAHHLGLSFLTDLQASADSGREAIIPGCFHQHASHVAVACFGDRPLAARRAAGVLRGHQSQETHQLPR